VVTEEIIEGAWNICNNEFVLKNDFGGTGSYEFGLCFAKYFLQIEEEMPWWAQAYQATACAGCGGIAKKAGEKLAAKYAEKQAIKKAAEKKLAEEAAEKLAKKKAAEEVAEKKLAEKTGSYTNTHASGKTYHGKGSEARARTSAAEKARQYNDPLDHTDWKPANNSREAFKDEAIRIRNDGGVKNPNNYNKINSPGEKYLKEDGL